MAQVPFSESQFFDVFESYNRALWPALFLLYAAALIAILGGIRSGTDEGRRTSGWDSRWTRRSLFALAFLWAWMGVAYHWTFFTRINPAAYGFGAMCVLQSALLIRAAFRPLAWRLHFASGPRSWIAASLLVYALVLYPIVGFVLGHRFPRTPTFGLPCPTTILTIAILMIARPRAPFALVVIPWIWSVIATPAAYQFGVWEDLGLLAAGAVSLVLWLGSGTSRVPGRSPAKLSEEPPPPSGPFE